MADEKKGVKETKEVLDAVNALAVCMIEEFRDGIQFDDFMDLYAKITADDSFKQKMMLAYAGFKAIPEEMKDLDVAEVVELSSLQLSYIPKILEAVKKPKA